MAEAVTTSLLSSCKHTLKSLSEAITALDSIGALTRLKEDGEAMEALKVVGVLCQSLLLPSTTISLVSEKSTETYESADTNQRTKLLDAGQRVRGGAFSLRLLTICIESNQKYFEKEKHLYRRRCGGPYSRRQWVAGWPR